MRQTRHFAMAAVPLVALTALVVSGCVASTQKELQQGDDYATQVERRLPIIRDPEVARYITVLGDSIAHVSDDRSLDWTFTVIDQNEINAFAIPGGHVYVYRGLIDHSATMSELAGVMAHEIAHVTRRHGVNQEANQKRANVALAIGCIIAPSVCSNGLASTAVNATSTLAFSKFSRNDEADADRYGVEYVTRAGIDPRGMPSMFYTLIAERKTNPGGLDNFFASHPVEESRVAATQAEIAKIDPAVLKSLTRDSRAFQSFKTRLSQLPKAKK